MLAHTHGHYNVCGVQLMTTMAWCVVTYHFPTLAQGHLTLREVMSAMPWHDGVVTYVIDSDRWLCMAQGLHALCTRTTKPWALSHGSLL